MTAAACQRPLGSNCLTRLRGSRGSLLERRSSFRDSRVRPARVIVEQPLAIVNEVSLDAAKKSALSATTSVNRKPFGGAFRCLSSGLKMRRRYGVEQHSHNRLSRPAASFLARVGQSRAFRAGVPTEPRSAQFNAAAMSGNENRPGQCRSCQRNLREMRPSTTRKYMPQIVLIDADGLTKIIGHDWQWSCPTATS